MNSEVKTHVIQSGIVLFYIHLFEIVLSEPVFSGIWSWLVFVMDI